MRRYLIALSMMALLGGCAGLKDPYMRAGTYAPTGVNDDNLRLMAVNPVDLQQGKGPPDTTGTNAVAAVTRYRTDNIKQLPDSVISSVAGGAGSGGQASGGGGGATQ
jgi:hypothetical protein